MRKFPKLLLVFLVLFSVVGLFVYYAVDVLMKFFPLKNPEAVVFTMTNVIGNAYKIVWILLQPCIQKAVENALFALSLIGIASLIFALIYCKKNFSADSSLRNLFKTAFMPFFVLIALFDTILLGVSIYKIPAVSYIKAYYPFLDDSPRYNPLYENDYVFPDSVSIKFENKKNLLFIILESMEYNFQDTKNGGNLPQNLIPEITKLMHENTSFVPGGIEVKGTGWTMGETIAKTCALPLFVPLGGNSDGIRQYLKNAVCLTDVLYQNEYSIELIQGTFANFASMDYFAKLHGIPKENVYDMRYFEKKGLIPDTNFFHGIKDGALYEEMKAVLQKKTDSPDKPWMLWFYTIDTHAPYGRLDSNCVDFPKDLKSENQYPYVLKCASKQISDFIDWAKTQVWFENTVIVVMGDHPAMISPEVAGFPQWKIEHYWLNFFVNSSIAYNGGGGRKFTSFDMFPTILEAMGAKIEGRALGLGRSLFSDEPTLVEKYGVDSLNTLLEMKSTIYSSFWK